MASTPLTRMGPPPRSLAADAQGCIMVRVIEPTEYKAAARSLRAPHAGSNRHPDTSQVCRRARSRQGRGPGWSPQRRPAYDGSCARRPVLVLRVGVRKRVLESRTRKLAIKRIVCVTHRLDKLVHIQGLPT